MTERHETTTTAGSIPSSRRLRSLVWALAVYSVAIPLALSVLVAGAPAGFLPPFLPTLWLAMAMLGPGAAAMVCVLRGGAGRVARDIAQRNGLEPQQIIIRVFFTGFVLAYLVLRAAFGAEIQGLIPLLAIDAPGVLYAWLLFIDLMIRPSPSAVRRVTAMASDITFISAFLHVGEALAAPLFSIYLWVTLGFGFRFGLRALFAAALLSLAGFTAVYATTPYWQEHSALSAGVLLALVLLPAYSANLISNLILARARAEEASAAKGRFLAIMSHELRTPLNSMIGMGSLFARTHLSAEQRDMLATMQLSARTLLGLINDILDFSKIDAGKLQPQIEAFVLHEVLGGAVAMLRPEAEAKGLALALRIDPRLPSTYRGMPLQLRQILVNLLTNAIKFTPQGRIDVSARLAGREGDSVRVRLAVRDDGIGIAPEARDKIFRVFTQADSTVTRRYGGTGLGLAIVEQLTRLMGGSIEVASELGKGSTFTIDLPLRQEPGASRPPELAGREVLVLTADPHLAKMLQVRLGAWHASVQCLREAEDVARRVAEIGHIGRRPLLLLDGRADALAALTLAHRLAGAAPQAPLSLFIAAPGGAESIAGLASDHLAAIIDAPADETILASAVLAALASDSRAVASAAEPLLGPAAASSSHAPARPLKILVAEDNNANRKIFRRILEVAGHQVAVVDDGEAALSLLDRERFDLALMDINMPDMSGYEVSKLYRMAHLGEPRLPIIALTADATSETERQCREAGMDAVLIKPLDAGQLLAAIDETHARVAAPGSAAAPPPVVTPISVHPRYYSDTGAVVDEATIEALRSLGGGSDFLGDVIDTFRADGRRLLEDLSRAVAAGDVRRFRELLHSLRSGAANIGAARLCQTMATLREATAKDLRQHGASYIDKLQAEFAKLETALERMAENSRSA